MLELLHTDLGQPVVSYPGSTASALHISFSHDEAIHLSMAAEGDSCAGVGADIVYLPRLLNGYRRRETSGKRGREYFLNFASRFMSVDEWLNYLHFACKEEDASLLIRTAAHFSLMESVSKALGAGLKMGGGIGKPTSLPRTSINILKLNPVVVTELNNQAIERARMLGADVIESGWYCSGNYLLSYAILFR
jgi:phosphopantetheinyl transferase (holo-ACP synthase)